MYCYVSRTLRYQEKNIFIKFNLATLEPVMFLFFIVCLHFKSAKISEML